jgi:hypothetical protein
MCPLSASQYPPHMGDASATSERPRAATARVAVHPSAMIRGVPAFVLEVPDGWTLDEAPGALCVVRHPRERNGFWVNVLIRHDRVPRSVDFEQAARIMSAKLRAAHPEVVDKGERLVRFGDNVVYTRGVELNGADGSPLAQMQALCFAPVDGVGKTVDLFQIAGTCRVDADVERNIEDIVGVIASFRFV